MSQSAPPQEDVDDEFTAALRAVLAEALADKRRQCQLVDPAVGSLAELLARFVLHGGKRLRPRFAWWGWQGAGGDPTSAEVRAVLRVTAALELLQAAALVHDDVIDRSDSRRGLPTVHVQLAGRHRAAGWLGEPQDFGVAGAILLGDIALTCADDLVRESGLAPAALRRAGSIWTAMRAELLGGQYLDLCAQAAGDDSEDAALRVARFKSAAYTVARPLQLGGSIAGAQARLMKAYHRFGTDVGIAFQLRDDLLGVFGDPSVTGKPAGEDLREGKRTLLVAVALRAAAERGAAGTAAATAIRNALGRPDLTRQALDRARAALIELGAVDAVERRIAVLTDAALTALDAAPVAAGAARRLAELAVAATRRDR